MVNATWHPRSETLCRKISLYYRKLQILVIVTNRCFQTYMWPTFQFFGAVGVIALLFPLLTFQQFLPKLLKIGLIWLAVLLSGMCCIILNSGSLMQVYSKCILKSVTTSKKNCKWSKAFYKSCPPITLKIGAFHKMDRSRVPAFIRFVLQRTTLLVVKTKADSAVYEFGISLLQGNC